MLRNTQQYQYFFDNIIMFHIIVRDPIFVLLISTTYVYVTNSHNTFATYSDNA